jgi:hypothetical protein
VYNLLARPEDLERLTVPKDIPYGIVSLLRLLCVTKPSFAELNWPRQATFASAPDQWFEMRRGGEVLGYLRAGETSGRSSDTRPDGVADDEMRSIETPLSPPTALRDFLELLGERLALTNPVKAENVRACARVLREDETHRAYAESRTLIDALAWSFAPQLSEAMVMAEYEKSLHQRYRSFKIEGYLIGFMYMLTHTARAADTKRALSQALRDSKPANVHGIYEFTDFLLSSVMRIDGGRGWILSAAEELSAKTEVMLDQAASAKSTGEFYGKMFTAAPLAYGAKRAYTFLASAVSGDQSTEYQRLANVSDERFATIGAALNMDFGNAMDYRYVLAHRRAIERERQKKGDWAAERLADEYINIAMVYPQFFRPFLLGQTQTLTLSTLESDALVDQAALELRGGGEDGDDQLADAVAAAVIAEVEQP